MRSQLELARFSDATAERKKIGINQKLIESAALLRRYVDDEQVDTAITTENFYLGLLPQLSPYDIPYLPDEVRFVRVPEQLQEVQMQERSYDLIKWNQPSQFLQRLQISKEPFKQPKPGKSRVMDRLAAEGTVVSFDDLRIDSPEPQNGRSSRTEVNNGIELNIMGQGRIPFVLGSVPDVGNFLSYVTMAQANGMTFISRDKLLSNIERQTYLASEVIKFLDTVELPHQLYPSSSELEKFLKLTNSNSQNSADGLDEYFKTLRKSWIANVGAAIEADATTEARGLHRAESLYNEGCKLFRIYSPEGGTEIIDTAKTLRDIFKDDGEVKIVGGQIMDEGTALRAEDAGCDGLFIGVAGGSQCTTSVNADIPVKTPNLLYDLRGKIKIPVGVEGGGVGTHIMTAFALGASFVSKPGEIGVSWEGTGGQFMFQGPDNKYYIPYGGEASISAKWWKDSIDTIGRPKFVEGETGIREIPHENASGLERIGSQTGNIKRLRDQLSVGLVFQRAKSIQELHTRDCDNVVQVTSSASNLSLPYAS